MTSWVTGRHPGHHHCLHAQSGLRVADMASGTAGATPSASKLLLHGGSRALSPDGRGCLASAENHHFWSRRPPAALHRPTLTFYLLVHMAVRTARAGAFAYSALAFRDVRAM